MKKTQYLYFFLLLSICVIVLSCISPFPNKNVKEIPVQKEDMKLNILEQYGAFVFEREGCNFCHPLNVQEASGAKVSLDGYHGKRTPTFTYTAVIAPKDIFPQSVMPSYAFLTEESFSKAVLYKIAPETNNVDSLWNELLQQADNTIDQFKFPEGHNPDKNEVVALIAFLQQIPPSAAQKKMDSLLTIKYQRELEVKQKLINSYGETLDQTVSNEENINKGKILYLKHCLPCHGENGEKSIGPALNDSIWKYGSSKEEIAEIVVKGTSKGMPGAHYSLQPLDIAQITLYVKSFTK